MLPGAANYTIDAYGAALLYKEWQPQGSDPNLIPGWSISDI